MEKKIEQGLLYDFYGELLTQHQKKIYEEAVYQDLSLSEIAEEEGITRQGVHDLIKRCDKIMLEYEEKLHLITRFTEAKAIMNEMIQLMDKEMKDNKDRQNTENVLRLKQLSDRLLHEL